MSATVYQLPSSVNSRFVTSDTTTPSSSDLISLVEVVGLSSRNEVGESLLVLRSNVVNGNDSRGLLASDKSETGLAFNDNVSTFFSDV